MECHQALVPGLLHLHCRFARDGQRLFLPGAYGLLVAVVADQLRGMADGAHVVRPVPDRRRVGGCRRPADAAGAWGPWAPDGARDPGPGVAKRRLPPPTPRAWGRG